ncbi:holin [Tuberibacillus sp. Marseille-P3662]|uniref:holin n=1 Tax=Tuberibacillus sp. Marseille-P3662 TaxID=1965358 RepID=UPI000A1CF227|nr:holin [Tuberibacillus sp. Marseille-P3662]
MNEILTFATIVLPIVTAVTELIKRTVSVPKNFVPLIALVTGLAIGYAATPMTNIDWVLRLWGGGIAGLSSTGLYEIAFNKREGKTKQNKAA